MAHGEVGGGVPEGLRQRPGDPVELEDYYRLYNWLRPHQARGCRTPAEVFHGDPHVVDWESSGREVFTGKEYPITGRGAGTPN